MVIVWSLIVWLAGLALLLLSRQHSRGEFIGAVIVLGGCLWLPIAAILA
ncbi:membrane protein [Mycobacterium phage Indlovu]|nr:membrane protein [Mycobacterium phage Indlovu]